MRRCEILSCTAPALYISEEFTRAHQKRTAAACGTEHLVQLQAELAKEGFAVKHWHEFQRPAEAMTAHTPIAVPSRAPHA